MYLKFHHIISQKHNSSYFPVTCSKHLSLYARKIESGPYVWLSLITRSISWAWETRLSRSYSMSEYVSSYDGVGSNWTTVFVTTVNKYKLKHKYYWSPFLLVGRYFVTVVGCLPNVPTFEMRSFVRFNFKPIRDFQEFTNGSWLSDSEFIFGVDECNGVVGDVKFAISCSNWSSFTL